MEILENLVRQITHMKLSDYIDIALMAFLLYRVLPMLWHSGAMRIVKAIVAVVMIAWITDILNLYTLNYLVGQVLKVGIIALVILFQPELRRILDHIGNVKLAKLH